MPSDAPTTYNDTQLPLSIPNANPNSGNTFKGWTGSNGTTPQKNISIPVGSTGAKTYYANWDINTYIVHFNGNGGIGSMADQTFQFNVYQRLSENEVAKYYATAFNGNGGTAAKPEILSYLQFLGWAKSASGSVAYDNKANVVNVASGSEATLYAKWGGADKISLPNTTRTGYSFEGWYTQASSGTRIGGSGTAYTPTGDATFYAHWRANTYTVTLDPTLGSVSPTSITVTFDQQYGNLPVPTSPEYEFLGWFTQAEGGTQVTASTTVKTPRNHTLYAHWKDGMMTLTFDPMYGDLPEGVEDTRRCRAGRPFGELPEPTRTGYIFIGWYDAEESGNEVTAQTVAPEEDMTIYAAWLPISYKVRFDANGGTGQMDDQVFVYGNGAYLDANQFQNSGSIFLGWSSGQRGDVRWEDGEYVNNLSDTLDDVVVMYAIWLTDPITVTFHSNWDQYTMTFDANGGTGGWSKRLDAGAALTPPTVAKTNYIFNGWSPAVPSAMPASDLTCVAQWTPYSLTATVTTQDATATCSNVRPSDATVQYSTSSKTSGYQAGTQFTLPFTANKTQTKNGWFKLSYPGAQDAIYKVAITQTYKVTRNWSSWSSWAGPASGADVYAYAQRLKRNYGEGNYEIEVIPGYYARAKYVTSTSSSTTYSSEVTRVQ